MRKKTKKINIFELNEDVTISIHASIHLNT